MEADELIQFDLERNEGPSVHVSVGADSSIDEVIEAFRAFLLAAGYSPTVVAEYLPEE